MRRTKKRLCLPVIGWETRTQCWYFNLVYPSLFSFLHSSFSQFSIRSNIVLIKFLAPGPFILSYWSSANLFCQCGWKLFGYIFICAISNSRFLLLLLHCVFINYHHHHHYCCRLLASLSFVSFLNVSSLLDSNVS